ncbi:MAG: leucine-rich repeat protein, partial [Clostridia bacterium]|nr:leucine-rich repeat protein [Clostridia bacterium]
KLVSIGGNAFKGCTALTKVTISASVNSIGKSAFGGCKKLKTITIKSTLLTKKNVKSGAFKGIAANATVKCPKAKVKDYQKFLPGKGVPKTAKIK